MRTPPASFSLSAHLISRTDDTIDPTTRITLNDHGKITDLGRVEFQNSCTVQNMNIKSSKPSRPPRILLFVIYRVLSLALRLSTLPLTPSLRLPNQASKQATKQPTNLTREHALDARMPTDRPNISISRLSLGCSDDSLRPEGRSSRH